MWSEDYKKLIIGEEEEKPFMKKRKGIIIGTVVTMVLLAVIGVKFYVTNQETNAARNLFMEWFHDVEVEDVEEWRAYDMRKGYYPQEIIDIALTNEEKKEFCQLMKSVSWDEVTLGPGSPEVKMLDLQLLLAEDGAWIFRFDGEVIYVYGVPDELNEIYGYWSWEIRNDKLNEFLTELLQKEVDNGLPQNKLDWFETVFFNQEENHITNMFLASEYASVADVNLGRLFHSGADGMGGNGEVPEEEATLVIDKFGLEKLDVAKATIAEMDAVLQKYAGLTIETTNKVGFDSLYYLEEKDAYYNVSGDTAYMKCNIVKGWTNEDGTITLQYKDALSSISDTFEVTLKAVDDSYQFVSNKRVAE